MATQAATKEEQFKVRITPALKVRLDEMFARKQISRQEGVEALLAWLLEQDDVVQSVVMGQIAPRPDVFKLIERRMLAAKPAAGKVHAHRGLEK